MRKYYELTAAGLPGIVAQPSALAQPVATVTGRRGFAIAAALTLSFGGIVVPVLASGMWVVTSDVVSTGGPTAAEAVGPLVPGWYDVIWYAVIGLGLLLVPASGLWLLWRLRGRGQR